MITGYIGLEPFAVLDGNPEYEMIPNRETSKPFRRGRAFTEEASRTPLLELYGMVDLLLPGHRQQRKLVYRNMQISRAIVNVEILVGNDMEIWPGWQVLNVRDVTRNKYAAVASGGVVGGRYILETLWTLAHVDVGPL